MSARVIFLACFHNDLAKVVKPWLTLSSLSLTCRSQMWLAIAMTVLAATGNSVGKVLQKQAAARLPRLVLRGEVVRQFLGSRLYLLGLACDLVGALLVRRACTLKSL